MHNMDSFQKFMFPDLHVRGEWVRLSTSFKEVCARKHYPERIKEVLVHTAASAVLMTGTLKFEGRLSIHARGNGPISLLTAECDDQKRYRCLANFDESENFDSAKDLQALLGEAQLAITIDPAKGQRYQGIVPLERESVADCLEHYFELSEQLDSHFAFYTTENGVYALMLQKLPDYRHIEDQDAWNRLIQFAQTLTAEEVEHADNETLTTRLFHEENVQLYDSEVVEFRCTCSTERSLASLKAIGVEECLSILEEEPVIAIDCQFCGTHYEFERDAINQLFELGTPH